MKMKLVLRDFIKCRHWLGINEVIENAFSNLSSDRFITFKLEELVESKKYLNLFLDFLIRS